MKRSAIVFALSLLASTGTVMAQGHGGHGRGTPEPVRALSTQVHASQCWVRMMPEPTPSAAYLELENKGEQSVAVTGASSLSFGHVILHQTSESEGMARMSHVSEVEIPAGGVLSLKPGAFHVMLGQAKEDLALGERIILSIHLSDDTQVQAECELRPAKTQAY
ncbi:copper chaperone PCu(A)C [Alcaligenes sp. NLF5-7]|uniref:copper chaperone PCu(A)C n=1 Tax=Alcaligenes sp. NLF5-7 TaxID=2918755 RepID=UPI0020C3FED5|nr:copper chaperone PCu(A)C [Alcaligenes sp. NLF5-7]UTM00271.1 copper chaperone PCu(A)C [Alcaligenes sp. NLF5-7]